MFRALAALRGAHRDAAGDAPDVARLIPSPRLPPRRIARPPPPQCQLARAALGISRAGHGRGGSVRGGGSGGRTMQRQRRRAGDVAADFAAGAADAAA